MKFTDFFINRPVFAIVLSLLLLVLAAGHLWTSRCDSIPTWRSVS